MANRTRKQSENEILISMIGQADNNEVDIKKIHEEAELNFIREKLLSGEYTLIRKDKINKLKQEGEFK